MHDFGVCPERKHREFAGNKLVNGHIPGHLADPPTGPRPMTNDRRNVRKDFPHSAKFTGGDHPSILATF
jgi:hypothetical protein